MTVEAPMVSVVIPAFNASGSLNGQLAALADQVDAPVFEVVVADNGSTDGTAALAGDFPGLTVRVVDASRRKGSAHARNVGAAAASSDVLLFCDADDVVAPDWVATLLGALVASGFGVVAGNLVVDDNPADVVSAYRMDTTPRDNSELLTDLGPFAGLLPTVCSANFAMTRTDYLASGGMDESYRGGCEETDFSWRLQERGLRISFSPRAQVAYRLRNTPRGIFRQQRHYQRERILLWLRFRDHGMSGPSLRISTMELIKGVASLPWWLASKRTRLLRAWSMGGHFGALEGMLVYRLLGRIPPRALSGDP